MGRKRYKVGDVFVIPIWEEEKDRRIMKPPYIFGRVILIQPSKDFILEIFRYLGDIPKNIEDVFNSGLLLKPIDSARIQDISKKILSDETYDVSIKYLEYLEKMENGWFWEKHKELEGGWIIHTPEQVEGRIRKALGLSYDYPWDK